LRSGSTIVNRASLATIIGFLPWFFGCSKQPPPARATSPADMFMVDYAHVSNGAFHHGTFSLIGGKVGVTWTVDEGGNKKSRDLPMSKEAFQSGWDSLNEVADFNAGVVTDPNQRLDPKAHHIVGMVFNIGGKEGTRTHMIPAANTSSAFKQWLSKLGYTGE
jgi:hypothetical protein